MRQGVFLIRDPTGRYWTGKVWKPAREQARQYQGPLDPQGEARGLVARMKGKGKPCFLVYYPSGLPGVKEPTVP